jgi:signal transduction histidine kinase
VHRLLARQLKRHFGKDFDLDGFSPEMRAFIEMLDETYLTNDKERKLLENTISLNSEELYAAKKKVDQQNEALQHVNASLEQKVSERTMELLEQTRRAEQANEAKSVFLANMSHELRTPLNAIIGFSQILVKRPDINDKYKEYIKKVNIAGQNMLILVNTLLDFSKVEDGKIDFMPQPFRLANVIDELKVLFEYQASEKQIEMQFPDLADAEVSADMQLLKQVLINLLSNAIKFSPDNSRVELHYSSDGTRHRFAVVDQGAGIAPEELETLFDAFIQGEASKNLSIKGTGLGLNLSKKIIEEYHHGRIYCESELGSGSTFFVEIPVGLEERS